MSLFWPYEYLFSYFLHNMQKMIFNHWWALNNECIPKYTAGYNYLSIPEATNYKNDSSGEIHLLSLTLSKAEWRIYASVQPTSMGSDNGLSPVRRQVIIWINAAILSIRPQWTYFSETLFKIRKFSFKKMHLNMSSAKWRPFCLGLNVLPHWGRDGVDAITQTTFSSAFFCEKMFEFRLKFHWSLCLRVPLTIFQHWFR